MEVFRIFISKERSFLPDVCFWWDVRSTVLAGCAGCWNTAQDWLCCACPFWEHSGAFWIAAQNASQWECWREALMELILVFPCCLRCNRRQVFIFEKCKYTILCRLEVLRPSRHFPLSCKGNGDIRLREYLRHVIFSGRELRDTWLPKRR